MSWLNSVIAPVFFPTVLWHTTSHSVHITFDDGPHPSATPKVLEILRRRNIRGTFFLLGQNVRKYPEIALEIARQGHTIGNHGYSHKSMIFKSGVFQRMEIQTTAKLTEDVLGQRPVFFRPPYGHFDFRTIRLARAEGCKMVMWNVDPRDFSDASPGRIARRVAQQTKWGSIILLHDNEKTTAVIEHYIDPLLDRLTDMGFEFSVLPS